MRVYYFFSLIFALLVPVEASARGFRVSQVPNGGTFGCQTCHVGAPRPAPIASAMGVPPSCSTHEAGRSGLGLLLIAIAILLISRSLGRVAVRIDQERSKDPRS